MANFNIGDTVQLKSGGPLMTVAYYNHDGQCVCNWFNNKDEVITAVFHDEMLAKED